MFDKIKTTSHVTLAYALPSQMRASIQKLRARQADQAYAESIVASQAKIGPYVPTPCPVQIWT